VIIDQELLTLAVTILGEAGEVEFANAFYRKRIYIGRSVEAVIDRRNVHVVDVEQQSATRSLSDRRQKFNL